MGKVCNDSDVGRKGGKGMQLLFATTNQFRKIWDRLQPQQRLMCDLKPNSLKLIGTDTIITTREDFKLGSIESLGEDLTLKDLFDVVDHKTFEKLEVTGA